MKKMLFILSVTALFAACSKSNEKPAVTPATATAADIQGKWKVVADSAIQIRTPGQVAPQVRVTGPAYFVYNSNNTGNIIDSTGLVTANFTYTVSGGIIKLTDNGNETDLGIRAISTDRMVIRETEGNEYADVGLEKQ